MTKPAIIVLGLLTVVFAVLAVYFTFKKKNAFRVILKSLASFCFMSLALISLLYAPFSQYFIFILLGLLFGFLGDVFLGMVYIAEEKYKKYLNLSGLLFFLCGHIAYIVSFILLSDTYNLWLLFIVPVLPIIVFILEKKGVFTAGHAFVPVLIYSAVLCLMLSAALNLLLVGGVFNTVIFIAALFFITSDSLLAFYNFSKLRSQGIMYAYMPLYYIAQIVFACALLI